MQAGWERRRRIQRMRDLGLSVASIAKSEGVTKSRIQQILIHADAERRQIQDRSSPAERYMRGRWDVAHLAHKMRHRFMFVDR